MYLPSFPRVGPRISRGASRPTRVVFVDQLRAQKESAWRAQPQRGSAGVHVMLSNAGTTSARGLPGGPARGKRCFCENLLDTGEASRAYPLYIRFLKKARARVRKTNKFESAPSELLDCLVTKVPKTRKTFFFERNGSFKECYYQQGSPRAKHGVFPEIFHLLY